MRSKNANFQIGPLIASIGLVAHERELCSRLYLSERRGCPPPTLDAGGTGPFGSPLTYWPSQQRRTPSLPRDKSDHSQSTLTTVNHIPVQSTKDKTRVQHTHTHTQHRASKRPLTTVSSELANVTETGGCALTRERNDDSGSNKLLNVVGT
jgi:hypothetical protein